MYIPLSLDCSTRQTRKYPILRVDEPLACIFLVSRVLILLFFFLNFFHLLSIYYSFIIFSSCFLSSICAICAIFVCRSASILLRTHPVSTATRRLQLKLHLQPHLFFFLSLSLSLSLFFFFFSSSYFSSLLLPISLSPLPLSSLPAPSLFCLSFVTYSRSLCYTAGLDALTSSSRFSPSVLGLLLSIIVF